MTCSVFLGKATLCVRILVVVTLFVAQTSIAEQTSHAATPLLSSSAPLPIVPTAPFSKSLAYLPEVELLILSLWPM